jgi:hypothetical protein
MQHNVLGDSQDLHFLKRKALMEVREVVLQLGSIDPAAGFHPAPAWYAQCMPIANWSHISTQ